ncbi:MAG: tight adherence protein [Actinomycetota bacterium]|jgi:tight adherence protein C|nr:tight adherence protein [Actinomycetota bacterium]
MANVALLVALALGLCGLWFVSAGMRARAPDADPEAYLRGLDDDLDEPLDEFSQRLRQPFLSRVLRPLGGGVLNSISRLTPGDHVQRCHHALLVAGLSASIRAEEFVTAQVLFTALTLVAGLLIVTTSHLSTSKDALVLLLFPAIGALGPQAWLTRKVTERKEAIFKDLPDILDLLAISVEAGMGFEGALDVVCNNFDSPLALEFSRTLKEMELGLPRREALQNLKRRTEVPELSNFVLALTQADALGMPIGRVLHAQAAEMRNKRRQWAREKAGKLPVKILFPLILFIFPAVLVVVLGPAAASIMKGLR